MEEVLRWQGGRSQFLMESGRCERADLAHGLATALWLKKPIETTRGLAFGLLHLGLRDSQAGYAYTAFKERVGRTEPRGIVLGELPRLPGNANLAKRLGFV